MDMIGHPPASRRSSSDARDSLRQHQLFSSAKRREDDGAPERQRRAFAERARCSGMRTGCTVRTAVVTRLISKILKFFFFHAERQLTGWEMAARSCPERSCASGLGEIRRCATVTHQVSGGGLGELGLDVSFRRDDAL